MERPSSNFCPPSHHPILSVCLVSSDRIVFSLFIAYFLVSFSPTGHGHTHGICPNATLRAYPPMYRSLYAYSFSFTKEPRNPSCDSQSLPIDDSHLNWKKRGN